MVNKLIKELLLTVGLDVSRPNKNLSLYRKLYNKYHDYTMIPEDAFVLNLELIKAYQNIIGDYVECGVWRGGMSGAAAEVIEPYRTIHLFDSFEGLPPAKEIDGKEALQWQKDTTSTNYHNNCAAEERFVKEAMALACYPKYKTYKGWFDQTLSSFDGDCIGILRLDGDWYDSIFVCLQHLFPKVSNGGIIILDDYYTWEGCSKAAHDYLSATKSPSRVHQWKNQIAYIIKKND